MLRSMTAYGRTESVLASGVLSCEIRSVNHRYLELGLRLPEELRALEPRVREAVAKRLKRGKVDLGMRFRAAESDGRAMTLDHELARQVVEAANSLSGMGAELAAIDPLKVLSWPGVVTKPDIDAETLGRDALEVMHNTLDDFVAAREREGEKTQAMLVERVDAIESIIASVRQIRPALRARLKDKLLSRLSELDVSVDQGRLEQELVYAAQKLDVDEELDRLGAHVSEIRSIFTRREPVGRRLDFLIQEFNREANTLGAKSVDTDTTGFSVELKVLIEQMREQVQNLE